MGMVWGWYGDGMGMSALGRKTDPGFCGRKPRYEPKCSVSLEAPPPRWPMLAARVKQAVRAAPQRETPLFPYGLVKEYLETHPIVVHQSLDPRAVHAALISFHSFQETQTRDEAPARVSTCPECDDFVELDARAGAVVCRRCGLVTQVGVNVEPEYQEAPSVVARHRGVPGVAEWACHMVDAPEASFRDELEHWNQFTRLCEADLDDLEAILKRWGGVHASRVAAGLLYKGLRSKFLDESASRRTVQRGGSIGSEVTTTFPEADFPCTTCGRKCHDMRTARFHCRPFGKRKR
jgi:hypothetical protein